MPVFLSHLDAACVYCDLLEPEIAKKKNVLNIDTRWTLVTDDTSAMGGPSLVFDHQVTNIQRLSVDKHLADANVQWVETNSSNILIFPTDICFLPPHGTMLKALIQMLIQMFADVR